MLKPTADPITALRDQMDQTRVNLESALRAAGTQPPQTVRKLQALVQQVLDLVTRLPQVVSAGTVEHGFGLSDAGDGGDSFKTVASVTLTTPEGKNRVVISASAQGTVLDTTSGGITSSNCRLVINGVASAVIPASKDAGASVVQNVLVVSQVIEIPNVSGSVVIQFQMAPLNPAAFPAQSGNIANLSVYAGYSVI